jgi:hypothetical protein
VVPITTGKAPEILWSWLVGGGDTVKESGLKRAWFHMLGNTTNEVAFLIYLWRNVLKCI